MCIKKNCYNMDRKKLSLLLCFMVLSISGCTASSKTEFPEVSQLPLEQQTTLPSAQHPKELLPPEAVEGKEKEEPVTASIVVTGDVLMHLPVIRSGFDGTSYQFDSIFTYVDEYIQGADFAVANLETTLAGTDNGYPYSGYPRFNCPDEILDAAQNAGFDMLLTANNHCNDTGSLGMQRTLQEIQERGLYSLGTVNAADEADFQVVDLNGIHVGMICYTYGQWSDENPSVNGLPIAQDMAQQINVFDYGQLDRFYTEMETAISNMHTEGADAVVLYIHWGEEYRLTPTRYQTEIAQKMCDLGVDVIVGGHPHVLQPVELLTSTEDPAHRTVCVYSTGNAISNQRIARMDLKTGHTEDGMLFSFTFEKDANGTVFLKNAEVLPTWVYIRAEASSKTYHILPLDGESALWESRFELAEGEISDLQASYERTIELVGSGMQTVQSYLDTRNKQTES